MYFGGVDVEELADKYGTPLIVTDENIVRENYRAYVRAFSEFRDEISSVYDVDICYAVKANGSIAILRILAQEGAGADVVSGCELKAAMLAGIPSDKIIFNGNAKTDDELRLAVETGVLLCLDSLDEAEALSEIAHGLQLPSSDQPSSDQPSLPVERESVHVAVRVNPDISVKTHPKIATALKNSKFGIPAADIFNVFRRISLMKLIKLRGIHCHIGSQILDVSVFQEAAEKMLRIASSLQREYDIDFVDIGGGLGIKYSEDDVQPTPHDLADALKAAFRVAKLRRPVKLVLEPGRSIVGNASILLTKVQSVKRTAERNFAAVDAGFNILIRPAMYGAYHEIIPASCMRTDAENNRTDEFEEYTIVGPLCESGDVLGEHRKLPRLKRGEILVIMNVGAYGLSMSSQYNMRPRCAEVLVCNGKTELIRERETFGDLIRHQIIPPRLLKKLHDCSTCMGFND